jgi:hypothetical protein
LDPKLKSEISGHATDGAQLDLRIFWSETVLCMR